MKKLILTFGIFLAGLSIGFSQEKAAAIAPASGNGDKIVAKMKETCNLSDDQVAKVKPFAETFAKAKAENKEKYGKDPDQMQAANKTAKETFLGQLKTVLTPDQLEKFKAQQKQQMQAKSAGDKDKE